MFISVFQRAQAAAPQVFPLPRAPVSAAARLYQPARLCQAARLYQPARLCQAARLYQPARLCQAARLYQPARLFQAARPCRPAAGIYNHSFIQTARKCVSV